ncbi:hypothetical protein NW754_013514 [Fusarium falciforme]|nr:hypothetical protein NW754_013514 [Fusarium falciforme]
MYYISSPEFARHFSPSIFRLFLGSRADVSLIASAYISIFTNLVPNQRNAEDYVSTFRFYPLILRALIDSGADTDKIEAFRFNSLSPLFVVSTCEFVDAVSQVLDDMADSGASPADKAFAFSPLAEELRRCDPESLFT